MTPVATVWSTAFYRSVVRLTAVGVTTGAVTGALLGLLLAAPGAWAPGDLLGPVLLGLLFGAAASLPVVLLCAATGLVVAARAPQHRAAALGLLLVWPISLATLVLGLFAAGNDHSALRTVLEWASLVAVVVVAVLSTSRWVTSPLVSAAPD